MRLERLKNQNLTHRPCIFGHLSHGTFKTVRNKANYAPAYTYVNVYLEQMSQKVLKSKIREGKSKWLGGKGSRSCQNIKLKD